MPTITDALLDEMRQVGDPEADDRVAALMADEVRSTMTGLIGSARLGSSQLSDSLTRFPYEPPPEPDLVAAGQEVFQDHGPEILWILGCYSLPAAYAAKNGVEVLSQTGFLGAQTNRRLIETAIMVTDVMRPGALEPNGEGTETIDRVRIMHAAIRRLILDRTAPPWDSPTHGLPVNQEDMAGTLMTFSMLVIEGLRKLGIRLTRVEQTSFMATWSYIGTRLGVHPSLLPATVRDAKRLTKSIQSRQIAASPAGRALTAALLPVLESKTLPGIASATMRLCLPRAVWKGLGLRGHLLMDVVIRVAAFVMGIIDRTLLRFKRRSRLFRSISMGLVAHLLESERDPGRPLFEMPDDLRWWAAGQPPATPTARVFNRVMTRVASTAHA